MITVAYINFWNQTPLDIQDYWLSNFVKKNIGEIKLVTPDDNPDILFCSCFGNIENIKKEKAKVKIFFYGENLERLTPYNNIEILKKNFDLIVGFKYTDLDNKIIRLPLWLMYYDYYNMNDMNNNIITFLENKYNINSKIIKPNFCCLIANHDREGQRTILLREIEKYGKVICPSKFNHNYNSIQQGNEAKIQFVKQCKYNICPENSKYEGYFTEKIFQAFESGSIPVYWAIDEPEKEILNNNKYCFVRNINDKNEVSEKIKDVIENPEKYLEGNIFNENAYDVLKYYYNTFINEIKKRL
jgi:glycosyltransferase involved in cell wall biosynthesis